MCVYLIISFYYFILFVAIGIIFVLNVFTDITSTFSILFILSWKNKFLIDILYFLVYDINLAIVL